MVNPQGGTLYQIVRHQFYEEVDELHLRYKTDDTRVCDGNMVRFAIGTFSSFFSYFKTFRDLSGNRIANISTFSSVLSSFTVL